MWHMVGPRKMRAPGAADTTADTTADANAA